MVNNDVPTLMKMDHPDYFPYRYGQAFWSFMTGTYGDDWWFRTVLAFAEIELQMHERGTRNIEAALAVFPRNAHAAHIRAHLYYEVGERQAGLDYLRSWMKDYPRDGQLHCHVSWHVALWSMESGLMDDAWRIYDTQIAPQVKRHVAPHATAHG